MAAKNFTTMSLKVSVRVLYDKINSMDFTIDVNYYTSLITETITTRQPNFHGHVSFLVLVVMVLQ